MGLEGRPRQLLKNTETCACFPVALYSVTFMTFDISSPPSDPSEPFVADLPDRLLSELFEAGTSIIDLAPWKNLSDTDWFAIKDPDSGQIHVAAVMGKARQFYALNLYLPEEGIRFWNEFIKFGMPDTFLGQFQQRLVSCEFVIPNNEDMDETDIERNDKFGLADDAHSPLKALLFRGIVPACINWHPDETQARKLLDGLRLLPRFAKNPKLQGENHYTYLGEGRQPIISCFTLPKGKDRSNPDQWEVTKIPFPQAVPEPKIEIKNDPFFIARIGSAEVKPGTHWEIGEQFDHQQVLAHGVVQWTLLCLVAQHEHGMARGLQVVPATISREIIFKNCLAAAAAETGYLPEKLTVSSDLAARTFESLAKEKSITIEIAEPLGFDEEDSSLLGQVFTSFKHDMSIFETGGAFDNFSDEDHDQLAALTKNAPSPNSDPEELLQFLATISESGKGRELLRHLASELPTPDSFLDRLGLDEGEAPIFPQPGEIPVIGKPKSTQRLVFRIDLVGAKPPIWRRISLASDDTFFNLHLAIQAAFGWDGDHLHDFQVRNGRKVSTLISWRDFGSDSITTEVLPEHATRLDEFFEVDFDTMTYTYDFGDNWDHLIKLEKIESDPSAPPVKFIKGNGPNPVENCGGIGGLMALFEGDHPFAEAMTMTALDKIRDPKFDPVKVTPRDPIKEMQNLDLMFQ